MRITIIILLLIMIAVNIAFVVVDHTNWINWAAIVVCFIAVILQFFIPL